MHLILENEANQASRLERDGDGRPRSFTAQWNDDVHHVLHVAATGETTGYYGDYDASHLGQALAQGFAYQGERMAYSGEVRGEPSAHLPPDAFIAFVQNHDQVGNRAFGDRLHATVPPEAMRALAAVVLLLPQVPMLFMGEEWAAEQPFPYFCEFHDELARAVSEGRRDEFAAFPEFADPETRARIPDPIAEATFLSAKLDWSVLETAAHARRLELYRRLLALRHARIVPLLAGRRLQPARWSDIGPGAVEVVWPLEGGGALTLCAVLSDAGAPCAGAEAAEVLWAEGDVQRDQGWLGPWSVLWTLSEAAG